MLCLLFSVVPTGNTSDKAGYYKDLKGEFFSHACLVYNIHVSKKNKKQKTHKTTTTTTTKKREKKKHNTGSLSTNESKSTF